MIIIGRLRTEFSGIYILLAGILGAFKAVRAYNRALLDTKAIKEKMVEEEKIIGVSESRLHLQPDRMSKELVGVVYRAVGLASMCWSNIDGAGTFDAKEAEDIAVELCYTIADEIEAERDAVCRYSETTTQREGNIR